MSSLLLLSSRRSSLQYRLHLVYIGEYLRTATVGGGRAPDLAAVHSTAAGDEHPSPATERSFRFRASPIESRRRVQGSNLEHVRALGRPSHGCAVLWAGEACSVDGAQVSLLAPLSALALSLSLFPSTSLSLFLSLPLLIFLSMSPSFEPSLRTKSPFLSLVHPRACSFSRLLNLILHCT